MCNLMHILHKLFLKNPNHINDKYWEKTVLRHYENCLHIIIIILKLLVQVRTISTSCCCARSSPALEIKCCNSHECRQMRLVLVNGPQGKARPGQN